MSTPPSRTSWTKLGDLSKGAIYHHFKSKEAILEELTNRDNNMQDDFNESVMNRTDLTALESSACYGGIR